jgi:hypothetical protein
VKKDFDSLFEEIEPYHNLQARVGHGFFTAIEAAAKKRKQGVSEFLRGCVALQLVGEVLKKKASRLSSEEREIIEACKKQLEQLNETLIEGIKHQQLVERSVRRAHERLNKNEVVQRVVNELVEQMKKELFPTKPLKKRIR